MTRSELSIEARLRYALETEPREMVDGVDMSSDAVSQRLIEVCEMSSLCLMLVEVGLDLPLPPRT